MIANVPTHITDYQTLLSQALETIKKLTAKPPQPARKPIAILGMGCRLPGGCGDPETFWEFLRAGGDGIIEVPGNRWNIDETFNPEPLPGKSYVKEGGFLQEDVSLFDARFFGISPREANDMDPQQRLMLEVSWEALERAGIAADALKGSRTGVFIGQIGSEYATLPRPPSFASPYAMTGIMSNITAGRIAYILGVHGPAISIDTACSSSLVAVHLACESLDRGECDLAIVGGSSLMLSKNTFPMLCAIEALSRDGRCKTFSAKGDGYGRSEGCGAIVLKRAADARRDRDPILAVIKGSHINQDGPGSGLTVPNGQAQRKLLREMLAQTGIGPAQISYYEAHGTGTALGDPIEFDSLCDVFGNDAARSEPLVMGSVKSNIGHLEAAAGIAGLIKLVLCLQHKEIPPNLHLDPINPMIQLERIPAVVPQASIPWRGGDRPLMSAISSFGFSGTNAGMIVTEPPPMSPAVDEASEERPLHVLALSAKSQDALSDLAVRYERLLSDKQGSLPADICHTAGVGRSHFVHRLAVVAGERRTLCEHLTVRAAALTGAAAKPNRQPRRIAFLANGQSDRQLAARLLITQPIFQQASHTCDKLLKEMTGAGILESWSGGGGANTAVEAFCLQYGLLQVWRRWGVHPRAVLGAGNGELVGACAAGVMELRTALEMVTADTAVSTNVSLGNPQIHLLSATNGQPVSKSDMRSTSYWAEAVNRSAALEAGVAELLSQDYDTFVCLGPEQSDGTLADRIASADALCAFLSTDPWPDLVTSVANLYEAGVDIDWNGFDQGYARTRVPVPTYPFQRKRFWFEQTSENAADESASPSPTPPSQVTEALEGRLIHTPAKEKLFEFNLPLDAVPDVRDTHGVLHVGYYLELLARAMKHISPGTPFKVQQFTFIRVLILREEEENRVMLTLDTKSDKELTFTLHHLDANANAWNLHAHGVLWLGAPCSPLTAERDQETTTSLRQRITRHLTGSEFYDELLSARRVELGPGIRWITDVWSDRHEALAKFEAPSVIDADRHFEISRHPGVFDACAQLFHATLQDEVAGDMRFTVTEWSDVEWSACENSRELWCHVFVERYDPATTKLHGGFELLNEAGQTLVRVKSAVMKGTTEAHEKALHELAGEGAEGHPAAGDAEILHRLAATTTDERSRVIEDYISQSFAGLLGMDSNELDVEERLEDQGIDSLVALSAKKDLEAKFAVNIPVNILIQGPSIRELAATILPKIPIVPPVSEETNEPPEQIPEKTQESGWIARRTPNPAAKVKLFCLPHGGAGASSVFGGWQRLLPDEVEVCPIRLPGKTGRLEERPFEDIDSCIDALCEALEPELHQPYALYGHSIGGLIAYRLAFRLHQVHKQKPHHLFVGGYTSPSMQPNPVALFMRLKFIKAGYKEIPRPDQMALAPEAEQAKIRKMLASLINLDSDTVKTLLPSFLADLHLVYSFVWDGTRFDLPVTAFHGLDDYLVSEEEMKAWRTLTTGPFTCHLVSGDHMFIEEDQDQRKVVNYIKQALSVIWE
jgi:acyl transferase domain-containing protein/surfactin synthase thioesterase subunit